MLVQHEERHVGWKQVHACMSSCCAEGVNKEISRARQWNRVHKVSPVRIV